MRRGQFTRTGLVSRGVGPIIHIREHIHEAGLLPGSSSISIIACVEPGDGRRNRGLHRRSFEADEAQFRGRDVRVSVRAPPEGKVAPHGGESGARPYGFIAPRVLPGAQRSERRAGTRRDWIDRIIAGGRKRPRTETRAGVRRELRGGRVAPAPVVYPAAQVNVFGRARGLLAHPPDVCAGNRILPSSSAQQRARSQQKQTQRDRLGREEHRGVAAQQRRAGRVCRPRVRHQVR